MAKKEKYLTVIDLRDFLHKSLNAGLIRPGDPIVIYVGGREENADWADLRYGNHDRRILIC